MFLQYQCPHCKAVLEAEDSVGGSRVDCPECGNEFVAVPLSTPPPEERVDSYVGFLKAWKRRWTYWYRTGRASRSEYWWGFLSYLLEYLVASLFGPLVLLWYCVSFFPTICQGVRRLHDVGHSGGWVVAEFVLLLLVSFVLWLDPVYDFKYTVGPVLLLLFGIVLLITFIFTLRPGDKGPNKYGQCPD